MSVIVRVVVVVSLVLLLFVCAVTFASAEADDFRIVQYAFTCYGESAEGIEISFRSSQVSQFFFVPRPSTLLLGAFEGEGDYFFHAYIENEWRFIARQIRMHATTFEVCEYERMYLPSLFR